MFWITKVLTTGMGETTSDWLAHVLDPVVAVGLAGVALAAVLALQFTVTAYVPWIYWTAVVMVSVFGTMAADVAHVGLGVPYEVSAAAFLVALAVIFGLWYASERTLSVHRIRSRRREAFYWATVLVTFALGTAVGDLTAATLGLGYLSSGLLFAVLIAVPALAHRGLGLGAVPAFWAAYVVTRPLGASFADWMAAPGAHGGLGWDYGPVSAVLTVVIVALVLSLQAAQKSSSKETVPSTATW